MADIQPDDMEVYRIVNSILTSNTFVLNLPGSDYCWIIDIGDFEAINSYIHGKTIKGVFITHTHYDHIYGLPVLLEHFPDCLIYTSAEGKEGLASDKFNFSGYHGDPIVYDGPNVRVLDDGDIVEIFDGIELHAMITPGHDKSCVTYYTEDSAFTGDSYIPGFDVVTTFPRSNKEDSKISLEKIHELLKIRTIYPGHK